MDEWSDGSDHSWSASNNTTQYQEFMGTARYGYFELFGEVVIGSNIYIKNEILGRLRCMEILNGFLSF
jgi:hypothetical protein